jgi:glyoxylase-like metal-dependent hydrolase (beta-lactamase superfamily II)
LPVIEAGQALVVDDGHEVEGHLLLEPAPGHTPGHVAIWLNSKEQTGAFTGDVLHHPIQVLNPHLSCMGCLNPAEAVTTRRRILARCAETDATLFPGHFMAPHAAQITARVGGFAFRFLCDAGRD